METSANGLSGLASQSFFLFRHGQTNWNAQERFQGHLDIPLNDVGREQARTLAELLVPQGLEALLSSDLSRALETGQIVAERLGLSIHQDADLREAFLGDAQGLTREEIEARFGEDLARKWRSSHVSDADISYPGGETGNAIKLRTYAALERFAQAHPQLSRIGVASHGGVIRRMIHALLPSGSPPVPIPNAVLYELVYRPGAVLGSAESRWTIADESLARLEQAWADGFTY